MQTDRAEETKDWDILNELGREKIKATDAHERLGWSVRKFRSAWKTCVKTPFDPEAMLSNVFLESLRASSEEDYNRKVRARKERYAAKKGTQGKN